MTQKAIRPATLCNQLKHPIGLPDRQFPFRAENKAEEEIVLRESNRVLLGVEPMIHDIIRRLGPNVSEHEVDDIAQDCMLEMYRKSLPKFDTGRGTKISTFLYVCISNYVKQELRRLSRDTASRLSGRKPTEHTIDRDIMVSLTSSIGSREDAEIEHQISLVLDHPDRFLTEEQTKVFVAWRDNPEMSSPDLARKLGYGRKASLSNMMRRIRARITEKFQNGEIE